MRPCQNYSVHCVVVTIFLFFAGISQGTDDANLSEVCLDLTARTVEALDLLRDKFTDESELKNGSQQERNISQPYFTQDAFSRLMKSVGLGRGTITVRTTEHHWKMMVISKKTKSTTRFYEHGERSRRNHDDMDSEVIAADEVQVHIDPNVFINGDKSENPTVKPFKHQTHFDMDRHPNELCLNSSSLIAKYNFKQEVITYPEMVQMCPEILNQIAQMACVHHTVDVEIVMDDDSKSMSMLHRIIFALMITGAIGALSISVSFLLKLYIDRHHGVSEGKNYKRVITFFIALAIGTLTGDAFLHLIPESMHSESEEEEHASHSQLAKRMIAVVATVYILYFIEKTLEAINTSQQTKESEKYQETETELRRNLGKISMTSQESELTSNHLLPENISEETPRVVSSAAPILCHSNETSPKKVQTKDKFTFEQVPQHDHNVQERPKLTMHDSCSGHNHGHSHGHSHGTSRSMMVIIGDAFHNFIDGLAIGSAFSSSLVDGLATSIAVALHEIPHEVGDFVVLVSNGVKPNQVLKMALISNTVALAGVGAGALIGSSASESAYVLCTAAGCFIYVGFINMLPHAIDTSGPDLVVQGVMHVLGILAGLAIMTLIALHESNISDFVENLFN